eukprot:4152392-Amphidinium_carterae.1
MPCTTLPMRTLWLKHKVFEHAAMSVCVRKYSASHTPRMRIQEAAQNERDSIYEEPPPSGSRAGGGGQQPEYENDEQYAESMTQKENRTNWA